MADVSKALKSVWRLFTNQEGKSNRFERNYSLGPVYSTRPDRVRSNFANEKSIITSLYNRIAIDFSDQEIRHVEVDDQGRYKKDKTTYLNDCLTVEANIDQGARAFRQDIAMSLMLYGVIAIVPVDTTDSPVDGNSYDIKSLRVGEIVRWQPRHVVVKLYDDEAGIFKEVTVPKTMAAIVENPFYSVMNEPNSTLKRLVRALNLQDAADEETASGRLDIIIQLPYQTKSEALKDRAKERVTSLEAQLKGSQYGIGYVDGTERITQLNRPAENNMLKKIEYLTGMLYDQLGVTKEVFSGTADEKVMRNYHNRTIKPFLDAVVESMRRTFLTKTARTQGHSIEYFQDPFKLLTMDQVAELADKMTRNEIATSNEIRSAIGMRPRPEAKADELRNSNMPQPLESSSQGEKPTYESEIVDGDDDQRSMKDISDSLNSIVDRSGKTDRMVGEPSGKSTPTQKSVSLSKELAEIELKIAKAKKNLGQTNSKHSNE